MGLCKCPKRKVTNLFCFEHRVNVCESCLITNHERCVVETYVAWLSDSDYDPTCVLCSQTLESGETVRLKCLHVLHWECLNSRYSQLQVSSAFNVKCPRCLDTLFPPTNQTSPVVDKLRSRLETVNWGRFGLGLEPLSNDEHVQPNQEQQQQQKIPDAPNGIAPSVSPVPQQQHIHLQTAPNETGIGGRLTPVSVNARERKAPVAINMNSIGGGEDSVFTSRSKTVSADDRQPLLPSSEDIDGPDQKYARRSTAESHVQLNIIPRRTRRIFVIGIIAILLLILLWTLGKRARSQDNPLFDPHANPNIRMAESNHVQ